MKLTRSIWVGALVLMGPAALAQPRTLTVPTQYRTIQAAIDAAQKNDTVLVLPGYYPESIDFKGKAITVKSSGGPAATTLEGPMGNRQTVLFASAEGRRSVLEGFSVKHRSIGAWLVYVRQASPTIRGNHFGPHGSSAIVCSNSPAAVIEENLILYTSGPGAISITGGPDLVIRRNVIAENYSPTNGGGIACQGSAVIEDNLIVGNDADEPAGGIYYVGGSGTIRRNVIAGNFEGGVYVVPCSRVLVSQNLIGGNYGGGILIDDQFCRTTTTVQIRENVVLANYEYRRGGGVTVVGPLVHAMLVNNTILYNCARLGGGGLYVENKAGATVVNTVMHGNQAPTGREIALVGSRLTIRHSLVAGGKSSVSTVYASLHWGPGMIDGPPGFVDGANGDFHLRHDSLYRDAGTSAGVKLSAGDWEGDPRVAEAAVDIGTDEFYPRLYHGPVAIRGTTFDVRLLGWPGTAGLVGLATRRLPKPLSIPGLQGGLWLDPSTLAVIPAGLFDASGVRTLRFSVPASLPPALLATQALAGITLTNVNRLEIR